MGPTGMPKASAASSTVSAAMPSSTQRIASMRYGARIRLTRNPGALLTGSGSLSICRANAQARAMSSACVLAPWTTSTSIILDTGLKKCSPISRPGSFNGAPICSRGMLDVLVASSADGLAFASSATNSSRLASRFSKMASMMTSARAAPSPTTSGIRRSNASRTRRGSLRRSAKSLQARCIAGLSRSGD